MSEGRIPISGLDIRHLAIKTAHLIDEQVTTAKIADVAVTVEKTDDPQWVVSVDASKVTNIALTTTFQEITNVTLSIPSWVGTVSIFALARAQITNGSGGVQGVSCDVRLNDVDPFDASVQDVANGQIGMCANSQSFDVSSPGATIELSAYARVTTGTNSTNKVTLHAQLVGTR